MTRLWIVRHGNTFAPGEPPRRIGARTDLPLVESGRAQGAALGMWFAAQGIIFDRVAASPLARARETARLIVGDGGDIATMPWLDEIDHGPDEDRSEDEVVARIGAGALAAWDRDALPPPGWRVDADARTAGWRAALAAAQGDRLLVTSNGAARFALRADAALAEQARALPHLKLRTGAWGLIERRGDGWRLVEWDRRP